MSMARLRFPSRLELNRPAGSFNAAPLANVILTTFLYVSPVQTMPPWDQTGVPGDVGLAHFHSSTISGSASCTISRTFASVFPRQSPSSLIFSSMNAEADSTGTAFPCIAQTLAPTLAALRVTCNLRILLGRSCRNKSSKDVAFPHPQSRKDHYRKEDKPSCGGVVWKFFKRTINIAEYRNAKDDVNPAKNRTLGGSIHGRLRERVWCIVLRDIVLQSVDSRLLSRLRRPVGRF